MAIAAGRARPVVEALAFEARAALVTGAIALENEPDGDRSRKRGVGAESAEP